MSCLFAGSRWVGWCNETLEGPLELVFEFDNIKEFIGMNVHINHIVSRGVEVN